MYHSKAYFLYFMNIYDKSHTPQNLLAAFHCFRVLFFLGLLPCIFFFVVYMYLFIKLSNVEADSPEICIKV